MASGVGIHDDCLRVFEDIKLRHRWLYAIYRLSDDLRTIIVEEVAAPDKTYEDFVLKLKEAEKKRQCRYAVFDVKFLQNDVPQEKLAFFLWSPEIATVKQKMLYTSSKQAFRNKLRGLHAEIQCTDDSELCMSHVLEKCSRKYN